MKRILGIVAVLFVVSIASVSAQNKSSYKVGDYYADDTKRGFVFQVDEDGRSGKIISLGETKLPWYQGSKREKPQKMGLENEQFGLFNLVKLRHTEGWHELFPAFAWCADLGNGWYLPSTGELEEIAKQHKVLNDAMLRFPGAHQIQGIYWASNEDAQHADRSWTALHYGGSASMLKRDVNAVRAVACFKLESDAASQTPARSITHTPARNTARTTQTPPSATATTVKTYKVGDYYNDGTKEGIVFWVDASGKHGKIVSLDEGKLQWGTDEQYEKHIVTGACDEFDGKTNTDKIMARADRAAYPAFVWCRKKGRDWYLPALEELKSLLRDTSVCDAVEKSLKSKGADGFTRKPYWSSTEDQDLDTGTCAWYVYMYYGYTSTFPKNYYDCVRAVATF
ncbi:MAG: DUF1566 domain-containing protein [Alistipes sp.]|nr:DUF1566 domain-containing protein [Alistipes sp.]